VRSNTCITYRLRSRILMPSFRDEEYCKTLYFCCIVISRFWNVEILLHFNLAFSRYSTSIYQAFDGPTEFSWIFNFAIFSYSRNSQKFDAREKYVFYSKLWISYSESYSEVYPPVKFWRFSNAFYSRNNLVVTVNKQLIGQHSHETWRRLFIVWHNFLMS